MSITTAFVTARHNFRAARKAVEADFAALALKVPGYNPMTLAGKVDQWEMELAEGYHLSQFSYDNFKYYGEAAWVRLFEDATEEIQRNHRDLKRGGQI